MKNASLILTIIAMFLGITIPEYSFGQRQNNRNNNKQPDPQIEILQKENDSLKTELGKLTGELNAFKQKFENQKYSPEVDAMLNIEDTSIFNDNFMRFELGKVHPRSREMYQWVSNIHEFGDLLKQIEESHNSIEQINANLSNLPATTVKQLESLNSGIKDKIRKADGLRENIEKSYTDMKKTFSLSQMEYYNSLVDKLNNFINLYF